MSDLKLVAPDQPTPLERQLLNAAANEMPSAEQRMRVRQALGLPAVAVVPLAPASNTARRALLMKAVAGGVIVVSAAALLFYAGFGRTPHPNVPNAPAPIAAPSTPVQVPAPVTAERAPEPVAVPLPPVEPLPSNVPDVKLAPKNAHATNAAASSNATDAGDLTEQLRLIDAARSAVAAGDAKSATTAISAYQTRYPRGAFGQEAAVLRIETVDLQGNHAQAASLAKSFLAKHPNSPHVSVVQRIAARAQ
jgi:hypothetical protein